MELKNCGIFKLLDIQNLEDIFTEYNNAFHKCSKPTEVIAKHKQTKCLILSVFIRIINKSLAGLLYLKIKKLYCIAVENGSQKLDSRNELF